MPTVIGVLNGSTKSERSLRQKNMLLVSSKRFSDVYIVLMDNLSQAEAEAEATSGIPPILYPQGGCLCRGYRSQEVTRIKHPVTGVAASLWHVEAMFDNDFDPTDRDPGAPPESRRPVVSWGGELEDEVIQKDALTGKPIETKNREPIILTDQIVIPILNIERYERYPFDPDVILNYVNHTNETTFWGAPPGCALMLPIQVTEEPIEGTMYCKAKYQIKFKIKKNETGAIEPDGWVQRPLHRGFYYVPDDIDPIALFFPDDLWKYARIFLDDTGNPKEVNLNENGFRIGGTIAPAGPGEFLEFNTKHRIDFNQLSLGPF